MDGFLRAQSDVFSIGSYGEKDLPFIPSGARAFTTYDRFFCSLLGSTSPTARTCTRLSPTGGSTTAAVAAGLPGIGHRVRRFVDSTPGTVLLDEPLGSRGTVAGTAKTRTFGSFTACAFLEQQGDDPLFAFLRGHAPLHDVFPSRDCDETEPQEDAHAAA